MKVELAIKDRVVHKKDNSCLGTVVSVDIDCYPLEEYGVTTCQVLWDDAEDGVTDTQWTNKLEKVKE